MAGLADLVGSYQSTLKGFSDLDSKKLQREQMKQRIEDAKRKSAFLSKYPELQVGGPVSQGAALLHMYQGQQDPSMQQPQDQPQDQAPEQQQQAQDGSQQDPQISGWHPPEILQQHQQQQAAMQQQQRSPDPQHMNIMDYIRGSLQKSITPRLPPGAAGEAVGMQRELSKLDPNSPEYKQIKDAYDLNQAKEQSTLDRNKALTNSQSYRSLLNTNEKNRIMAYAAAMGYDTAEAAQKLSGGMTLKGLADEKGVNLKDIDPLYPLSGETIKKTRMRGAFISEIKTLEKRINEGMGPYGQRFFKLSLKQAVDAVKRENPDAQGKYLAARALGPELSALRLNASGATVGIEAIREMQDKSLLNSRIIESTVSPAARTAMNKYISQYISEANGAFTKNIKGSASLGRGPQLKSKGASRETSSSKKVLTFNASTQEFE